ncbi:MAG: alpha/beta fold hydrolase [Caulobacteraceae bacterium]
MNKVVRRVFSICNAAMAVVCISAAPVAAHATDLAAGVDASYGPELQGFSYPFPVSYFSFTSQRQPLHMAYMDVRPTGAPNGRTVVMLHGKNFCAATWEPTIPALTSAGYRVIAIDQVGFCKSSKPTAYQFSFQQLAANTRELLQSLGVRRFILVGHSTGGMLGVRYSLMHPEDIEQLVLVSPIGLEDWKAKGVPSQTVDQWYAQQGKTTAESVRSFEQGTYYAGSWRADFDKWVQMFAGQFNGPGRDLNAWESALLYDMIYTQPVFYELQDLKAPVLLISGDKDNSKLGKGFTPPDVLARLGHYPDLAKAAAARIPDARLVEYPDLGHASFIQDPQRFNKTLLDGIAPDHAPGQ